MKESFVMRFDEKDIEVVETLRSLGVPRKVSNMLAYLANGIEATSREIERGSDLRQPEVSIALRTLRKHNWIEEKMSKPEPRMTAASGQTGSDICVVIKGG